jgi:hypothetical protein
MSKNQTDLVQGTMSAGSDDASRYYRQALLQMKFGKDRIAPKGFEGDWEKTREAILSHQSEEDEIRLHVLAKLVNVKESSCEWDSVVALCNGETDRYKQADIIASSIWERELAARKLAVFSPPKTVLHGIYDRSEDAALAIRKAGGEDFKQRSLISKNLDVLSKLTGWKA